jgi:hypothetical protein
VNAVKTVLAWVVLFAIEVALLFSIVVAADAVDRHARRRRRKRPHGPRMKWRHREWVGDTATTRMVTHNPPVTPSEHEALIIANTHPECYVASHGGGGWVCIACSEWLVEAS